MSALQVNTLAWDNSDPQMLAAHRKVMDHFDIAVSYHVKTMAHGAWLDEVMNASDADVVGFLDLDCVPLNREIVLDAAQWAIDHQSFVGTAQVSNHIPPRSHIFAAPAFFDEFQSSSGDFGHRTQPDESLEIKPRRDHLSVVGHIADWLPPPSTERRAAGCACRGSTFQ